MNGQQLHEVRGVPAQPLALVQRLVHETHVALLQVAQAAVHQLRALRGRPAGEVGGLDERRPQAARGGVEGDAGTGDAAADDEHVEAFGGQPVEHRASGERGVGGGHAVECTGGAFTGLPLAQADQGFYRLSAPHNLMGDHECRFVTSNGGSWEPAAGLTRASSIRTTTTTPPSPRPSARGAGYVQPASSTPSPRERRPACGVAPPSANAAGSSVSGGAAPDPPGPRQTDAPATTGRRRAHAHVPRRPAGQPWRLARPADGAPGRPGPVGRAGQGGDDHDPVRAGDGRPADRLRRRAAGEGGDGRRAVGPARRGPRRRRARDPARRRPRPGGRHRRHGRRPLALDQRVHDGRARGRRRGGAGLQARREGGVVAVRHGRRPRGARRRHRAVAGRGAPLRRGGRHRVLLRAAVPPRLPLRRAGPPGDRHPDRVQPARPDGQPRAGAAPADRRRRRPLRRADARLAAGPRLDRRLGGARRRARRADDHRPVDGAGA